MSNDTNSTPMNTPTTAEVKEMYCIQDLIHEDGTLSFSKGKSYPIVEASKLDGVKFLNNQFEEHWMQESLHEYFIDKKILEDFAKRNHQSKQVEPQGILPSFPRQNESFLDYGRRAFGIREKNGSADFEQVEQPSQVPSDESFETYMRNARNEFVAAIIKHFPHEAKPSDVLNANRWIDIRVAAEDMLICFDQMRDRIKPNQD